MLEYIVPSMFSMISTWILLDWWIKTGSRLGFTGRDMNKPYEHYAVEGSGIWVVLSSVFGVLIYIAIETYGDRRGDVIPLLSITLTLILAGLIGLFDDLLGWKKGINPLGRVLFTIPLALPLMVVKAGTSIIEIPIIGLVDLGVLYPLFIVPVGVVGASNAFNMIAGYNGLEALQAIILLSFSLLLAYARGTPDMIAVTLPVIASIMVFYILYNRYPAKAFPGNSFTYGIGSLYASLAIYWNFEKYAVLTFALYFLELGLFLRGLINGVYKENFGKPLPDGSLVEPYDKAYSITHLVIMIMRRIRGRCTEQGVVALISTLQLIICTLSLVYVLTWR